MSFSTEDSLRQGCSLSPALFKINMETIHVGRVKEWTSIYEHCDSQRVHTLCYLMTTTILKYDEQTCRCNGANEI